MSAGSFFANKKFIYNGKEVENICFSMDRWFEKLRKLTLNIVECYTHGNLTLENILYIPENNKILFIDPYEENFIDCELLEISQLLQSSNAHYEILCNCQFEIKDREIVTNYTVPTGIREFNLKLIAWMSKVYSDVELELIRFFEITQFIRMIPFKLAVDPERAKLFYVLACSLSHENSKYA